YSDEPAARAVSRRARGSALPTPGQCAGGAAGGYCAATTDRLVPESGDAWRGRSPGGGDLAGTGNPSPPTGTAPAARSLCPMERQHAAAHKKIRVPALPRAAPDPSLSPGDPAVPSASRAASWEWPAGVGARSAHSDSPVPGADLTPAPSSLTLPQTAAPHRSWPPPAPRPPPAGPCHVPPCWSSRSPGAVASALASSG